MALVTVAAAQEIKAVDINQLVDALNGDDAVEIELVQTSAAAYALKLKNSAALSAPILLVTDSASSEVIKVLGDAVTIGKALTVQALTVAGDLDVQAITVNGALTGEVVDTANLADDAVTFAKMADDSVSYQQIVDGSVYTVALTNDAVDSSKAGNRVPQFYRRQGGSATEWNLTGATSYTPGAVTMQGGNASFDGSGDCAITFPVAFAGKPIVITTPDPPQGIQIVVALDGSETTATGFIARGLMYSGSNVWTTAGVLDTFNWFAVGPEAEGTITASTIAFVDSEVDTITDSGDGFVDAGFVAGQTITVTGSTSNNGTHTLASVAAGTLTLTTGGALTTEGAGNAVRIQSTFL